VSKNLRFDVEAYLHLLNKKITRAVINETLYYLLHRLL
jgi:hypothetical protein